MTEFLSEEMAESLPASDATMDDPDPALAGPTPPGYLVDLTPADRLLIATVERDLDRQRGDALSVIIRSHGLDPAGGGGFTFEDSPAGIVLRVTLP